MIARAIFDETDQETIERNEQMGLPTESRPVWLELHFNPSFIVAAYINMDNQINIFMGGTM